jgi:hypothetical protein
MRKQKVILFLKLIKKNRRKIAASTIRDEEEKSHEREEKREKTTNIRLSFNLWKANYYSTISCLNRLKIKL